VPRVGEYADDTSAKFNGQHAVDGH
jgi:hypothetical protein